MHSTIRATIHGHDRDRKNLWRLAGMALLAAFVLAPGAARAADECGALNSGNSFTEDCPAATYTNGIVYWNQANAVTLTVPGTATTTTITAPTNTGFDIGIVVGTATHASARNIALTVGGTGTSVDIVQASGPQANLWYRNTGIIVRQRSGGEATTTVDVKSGVTIGTSATDKMNNIGIDVHVGHNNNAAGAISVTSGATIYSANHAIQVTSTAAAAGAVTVTNSGAIVTDGRGIYVDYRGSAGAVTVTNSGAITSEDTSAFEGIYARTTGKDADGDDAGVTITHSAGAISVAMGGVGIKAHVGAARQETDTEHANYVAPMNAGLAKVAVTGGSVTSKGSAIQALNYEAGSVEVETSQGVTLTSTQGHGIDAVLTDVGNTEGTITVTNAATIAAGTTAMTMVRHGIYAGTAAGEGAIKIDNSGGIEATGDGIFVNKRGSAGAVSVTHSAGAIDAGQSGIHVQNAAGTAGAVTVMVTGGSVTAQGLHRNAVYLRQRGTGDAVVTVSSGATLTSKYNAGIHAGLPNQDNADGQVKITQGGTIAARGGIYAHVERASAVTIAAGVTTRETREAAEQPLIDITWTGSFSHGTTADVAPDDKGRFVPSDVARAIHDARGVEAGKATRYGTAAGIEAHVLSWNEVMTEVAKGDDPGAFANAAAVTALFADDADAAIKARAAAIIATFRDALANEALGTVPGADAIDTDDTEGLSDEEIETYLSVDSDDRRMLLRNVLAQSFSDEEKAVLQAVVTDTGLTDALLDAALPDGATDDEKMAYREAVRDLLKRYNIGDIKVAMTAGSIDSRGDGIRAYYTTPNDRNATPNDRNGAISVTVDAGASVTGGMAGIYVANAGMGRVAMNSDWGRNLLLPGDVDLRQQFVTVNGMVTGGTDAAVHLVGGGALLVGEMGKLVAGPGSSGRAILVNEPGRSEIVIRGEVRGGSGSGEDAVAAVETDGGGRIILRETGRVMLNEGASNAIDAKRAAGSDATTSITLIVDGDMVHRENAPEAYKRLGGGAVVGAAVRSNDDGEKVVRFAVLDEDGMTGMGMDAPLGEGGTTPDFSRFPEPPAMPVQEPVQPMDMRCGDASDDRCRLYEALPSVLLAMNGLPTYGERLAAARSETGGWARVEASRGEWKAADSTRTEVAYDHDRGGVRAGIDAAVGEDARIGVSVHGLQGSADMTQGGGEVELSGMGVGVSATAMAGGVYIDAQAQATWFDVEVTSRQGTTLLKTGGVDGGGWALGLEAGRPMAMGENLSLTPSLGLAWSRASLDDFTDARGTRVSMEDADSLMGRLGLAVAAETGGGLRLLGSAAVMREFSEDTEMRVPGTQLKASAETTGFRVGIGGVHSWGEGRYALQGSASYTSAGGDNSTVGGGLSLSVSF